MLLVAEPIAYRIHSLYRAPHIQFSREPTGSLSSIGARPSSASHEECRVATIRRLHPKTIDRRSTERPDGQYRKRNGRRIGRSSRNLGRFAALYKCNIQLIVYHGTVAALGRLRAWLKAPFVGQRRVQCQVSPTFTWASVHRAVSRRVVHLLRRPPPTASPPSHGRPRNKSSESFNCLTSLRLL